MDTEIIKENYEIFKLNELNAIKFECPFCGNTNIQCIECVIIFIMYVYGFGAVRCFRCGEMVELNYPNMDGFKSDIS
jgi:transcription elongation factor Elf1